VVALELRRHAWGRCVDDPATLLRLIACRMGQRLLVIEHRAEIAHVKPVAAHFKFEKMVSLA
jgi:hypothetical protein